MQVVTGQTEHPTNGRKTAITKDRVSFVRGSP